MKTRTLFVIGALMLSGSLTAQVETPQRSDERKERPQGQRPPTGRTGGRHGGPGGMGRPGGSGSRNANITYAGATELTASATETDKTYQSEKTDENALLVSTKEAVCITQPTISKTGNSQDGDNCSFYGVNAALLVKGGSTTTIKGGTITSNANGANGVFSYGGNGGRHSAHSDAYSGEASLKNGGQGDGTTVIIEDTKITTTGDGSVIIMTTGGGTTKARTLTVKHQWPFVGSHTQRPRRRHRDGRGWQLYQQRSGLARHLFYSRHHSV